MRWLGKRPGVLIIGFIIVTLFLLQGTHGFQFDTSVGAGWELKDELMGIGGGEAYKFSSNPVWFIHKFDRAASGTWDFDAADYGYPDVRVSMSSIREEMQPTTYGPAQSIFDIGKFKYVAQYHAYLFDVEIRTVAGVTHPDEWVHETMMPHEWANNWGEGGTRIGKPIAGDVFIRFANTPWGMLDYGPVPEGYKFNGYWLGVMDSKLEKKTGGQVPASGDVQENFRGFSKDVTSGQARFTMLADDGTFGKAYAQVPYGDKDKVLDPDIKNTVIIKLPYNLAAGADDQYDTWVNAGNGGITGLQAIDYYVTYTVNMQCVVIKEYQQNDPAISPDSRPIEKPQDYYSGYLPSWWDQYGLWIIIGGIIVCILLAAAGFLSLPVISLLMSGR